ETKAEGLVREFKIVLPQAALESAMTARLAEIAKTAKFNGFRPGKVPLHVVRQQYGDAVQGEVLERAVNDNIQKVLEDRKLRPAMQPEVKLLTTDFTKDIEYSLSCELLPDIGTTDFAKLNLTRFVAKATDDEVEKALLMSAKRLHGPEFVKEDRASKKGDVLVIDFKGESEGVAHPGMSGDNQRLELGSNMFIPGFEDQLLGAKKGDERTVNVSFPEDYHAAELAGKQATFQVSVKDLMEFGEIKLDDALAKEMGFESLDKVRDAIRQQIEADYADMAYDLLKRDLFDQLINQHNFALPPTLEKREFSALWQQYQVDKERGRVDAADKNKSDADLEKEYKNLAVRRVRLGLLLAEVGQQRKIRVTDQELRQVIMREARRFPGQEKMVFDFYAKNPQALERLQAPIFESKVVESILKDIQPAEKQVSPDGLRAELTKANKVNSH
ncbi:MAG: trigger factor, partial [Alphaproteobacteria bacterium]|nr:trigger factor [Alphaproteobacteria bacterium]